MSHPRQQQLQQHPRRQTLTPSSPAHQRHQNRIRRRPLRLQHIRLKTSQILHTRQRTNIGQLHNSPTIRP
jgi:hypothetical protein